MAQIIRRPETHNCYPELEQLNEPNPQPVGTVAECSCRRLYIVKDCQFERPYWALWQPPPREDE